MKPLLLLGWVSGKYVTHVFSHPSQACFAVIIVPLLARFERIPLIDAVMIRS